ncbi:MAG: hypothetical protein ACLFVJ_21470 [Persicimonas sp.]
MPDPTPSTQEPIWNESTLREMVGDERRSAQTRGWAIDKLGQMLDRSEVVPLAIDLLEAEDPHAAAYGLTTLEQICGPKCCHALGNFSERDDISVWAEALSKVLLASCSDEEGWREAFSTRGGPAYFDLWAERDPRGFSRAALRWWDTIVADDGDFLAACATAAQPELAEPLLGAIGQLPGDASERLDLVVRAIGQAGFGLPELDKDMPIEWHPPKDNVFLSRLDDAMLEARFGELADLVADGDWRAVRGHCLETVSLARDEGAGKLDVPALRWAFALADALGERPDILNEDYETARLSYALQEAVLLVFDIEATLERRTELTDALELHVWAIGAERDRLEDIIESRWDDSDEHQELVSRWLDEIDDEFEWLDALEAAARLAGYDLTPHVLALADEMSDERAGYDTDWAAETLIQVLKHQPEIIEAHPDELLLEDPVVADCSLLALSEQPWRWASELVLERFDALADREELDVLWETTAELGDPASLDRLLDYWQPGEARLAHAAAFVADIAGRLDELPAALKYELEQVSGREARYESRLEAMLDGDEGLDRALPNGERIELPLTCLECGKTDTFVFDELYFDSEQEIDPEAPFHAILLDRIVECPTCGSRDQFAPTERANHHVGSMLTALAEAPKWPEDAPIQVWHPELWDGSSFRLPTEGIERLTGQARAQPDDPEPWRRLGHFCTRFHADELAVEAYEHADALDGRGVPDPDELREVGIPTEPVGPKEAELLLEQYSRLQPRSVHDHTEAAAKLADSPLCECLVSADWREVEGLATVMVSRKTTDHTYAAAAFLVDLACQGIKTVIFPAALDEAAYGDLKRRLEDIHGTLEPCAPAQAARILDTAVRFALALGFFPHDDYFPARQILKGHDPADAQEDVPTGEEGFPVYVGNPDAMNPELERLYRRTGPDGFVSL